MGVLLRDMIQNDLSLNINLCKNPPTTPMCHFNVLDIKAWNENIQVFLPTVQFSIFLCAMAPSDGNMSC